LSKNNFTRPLCVCGGGVGVGCKTYYNNTVLQWYFMGFW